MMGGASMMGGAPASSGIPSITCWQKAGITVQMTFSKTPAMPNVLEILMSATNANPAPAENFLFQIAVPKVKHCSSPNWWCLFAGLPKCVLCYLLNFEADRQLTRPLCRPGPAPCLTS